MRSAPLARRQAIETPLRASNPADSQVIQGTSFCTSGAMA